jgi:hypothetical protein
MGPGFFAECEFSVEIFAFCNSQFAKKHLLAGAEAVNTIHPTKNISYKQ